MIFDLAVVVPVLIISMVAGSIQKEYAYFPLICSSIWVDEPIYAAFSGLMVIFLLWFAIKLSKSWR
jgi:hypothetical protein